jgi:hypothetical protein
MYWIEEILLIQVPTCLISETTAKSTLEQAVKTQKGSGISLYSFFSVSAMFQLLYRWESDTVPIVQEAVWVPGLVWMRT